MSMAYGEREKTIELIFHSAKNNNCNLIIVIFTTAGYKMR
jgi:hypothetical protein